MKWSSANAVAPADFPSGLDQPAPLAKSRCQRIWLPALLVLAALLPRALMAWKLDVICTDGALYIGLAEALDRGDLQGGLQEMNLNVYPAVLVLMHRLGFSWESGAEVWGVLAASLAVLPLFGWIRRQFNEPVAAVACLLYAVHPKLIGWSPEIIRDPTFWLLFTLALYLTWRAVTEVRLMLFMAAGATITLAALTRVEGLFLIIPLALWTAWRWRALEVGRGRLAWGAVLSVVALPAFVLLVNVTFLRHHPRWEGIRSTPLLVVQKWSARLFDWTATGAAAVPTPHKTTLAEEALNGIGRPLVFTYLRTIERGMMPHWIILIIVGAWCWRHVGRRRDQQPCLYLTLAILAGIWIHLGVARQSSSRYALPIVILTAPYAALGLMALAQRLTCWWQRTIAPMALHGAVCGGMLTILAVYGATDALTQDYKTRNEWANLGRWIAQAYGPEAMIVGSHEMTPIVRYYARARCQVFPSDSQAEDAAKLLRDCRPDVVVLSASQMPVDTRALLLRESRDLGLEALDGPAIPGDTQRYVVLGKARNGSRF
ncbi:MAG: glycosyltransferase family 39 protein [Planctomycetes bacterium]|nr:glycosyltransferase family 39 protein [Planctomycetota bacterium]